MSKDPLTHEKLLILIRTRFSLIGQELNDLERKRNMKLDYVDLMKIINCSYLDNEDCESDIDSTRDLRDAFSMIEKGRELFPNQPCLKISVKLNRK
jgi:uncharacterized protein YfkK (UPF0435 family)